MRKLNIPLGDLELEIDFLQPERRHNGGTGRMKVGMVLTVFVYKEFKDQQYKKLGVKELPMQTIEELAVALGETDLVEAIRQRAVVEALTNS